MDKELTRKSKFLSLILRHDPSKAGIVLDKNGWASVSEILKVTHLHKPELEQIVITNDKKRFEFNSDHSKIRAAQGHSIAVDVELEETIPTNDLYHGTASKYLESILQFGITKQNRQHVHLSKDYPTALKVGSRHGTPEILVVDAVKMHQDGCKLYISSNGVYLTDYVAPQYLKKVLDEL